MAAGVLSDINIWPAPFIQRLGGWDWELQQLSIQMSKGFCQICSHSIIRMLISTKFDSSILLLLLLLLLLCVLFRVKLQFQWVFIIFHYCSVNTSWRPDLITNRVMKRAYIVSLKLCLWLWSSPRLLTYRLTPKANNIKGLFAWSLTSKILNVLISCQEVFSVVEKLKFVCADLVKST